jgi:cytochrome oxidase Cu insertion factor (SCO1/SenC/PrrC family)
MKTFPCYVTFLKATLSTLVVIAIVGRLHAQVNNSSSPNQLLGHQMPPITGTTISGTAVDATFFKDNVVIIFFGNLINTTSLKQVEFLNQVQQDFYGHPFKILEVMPNATQDVKDFNDPSADNVGLAHQIRTNLQLPTMQYPVMATCDHRNPDNTLHPACDNVVKDYSITQYPVFCVVDRSGTIRYVHANLSPDNQQDWQILIEQQVNLLLKEQ